MDQNRPYLYDPQVGYLTTIWNGILNRKQTVIPQVLARPGYWLLIFLHLCVYTAYNKGILTDSHTDELHWGIVKVFSGLTTFFSAFYSNQCFQRFMGLYDDVRTLRGSILDVIFEVRLHFRPVGQAYVRIISRWLLVLTFMFFYEARTAYDPQLEGDAHWAKIVSCGLLKESEADYLRRYPMKHRIMILLHWCMVMSSSAYRQCVGVKDPKTTCPNNVLKSVIDKLLAVHRPATEVMDYLALPVPYPYYHLLNVMLFINLMFWAYCMGMSYSVFNPLVFFLMALIMMGLLELAAQLAQPFGDDEVDFPLEKWLCEMVSDVQALVEYKYTDTEGWQKILAAETELNVDISTLGTFFAQEEEMASPREVKRKPIKKLQQLQSKVEDNFQERQMSNRYVPLVEVSQGRESKGGCAVACMTVDEEFPDDADEVEILSS